MLELKLQLYKHIEFRTAASSFLSSINNKNIEMANTSEQPSTSRMETPQRVPRLPKYFMIPSHRHEQLERGLEDRGLTYLNHRELVFQVNEDLTTIHDRLRDNNDTNDNVRELHRIKMFLMQTDVDTYLDALDKCMEAMDRNPEMRRYLRRRGKSPLPPIPSH